MKTIKWYLLSGCCIGLLVYGILYLQPMGHAEQTSPNGSQKNAAIEKSLQPPKNKKTKRLPVVEVETVQPTELVETMELTGSVIPTKTARLASPAEGPVKRCATGDSEVREGDYVRAGQVVFEIGRDQAVDAQLISARQALREQAAELKRVEKLAEVGAIPGAQVDTARSRYENAKAQLAKSLVSHDDYLVKAPWDGIVAKVYKTEGEYVPPRTTLADIFDPGSLVVQFAVPEARSTEVILDMIVQLQLDAHPGRIIPAKITRIFPRLEEKTRTRLVEVTLEEEVDLLPGMFARVHVPLSQVTDAITVPTHSLVTALDGSENAFVVEGNKAVRRKLDTGLELNGRIQVLSGLKAGDKLIVAGQEKLKDGATVKIMEPIIDLARMKHKEGDRS